MHFANLIGILIDFVLLILIIFCFWWGAILVIQYFLIVYRNKEFASYEYTDTLEKI
jgi:hypothetical protein